MYDLVSVIIPTYGRPDTLKRAVDSVLKQTYKNIEVIIVDDNNPNTVERHLTEEVISKIDNKKIIYIKHIKNINGSAARNTGAKNSKGKYLMFLDDDDEFMEKKIQLQVEALKKHNHKINYCSYKDKVKGRLKSRSKKEPSGNLYLDALSRNLFLSAGSNLLLDRNVYFDVGGFDESFVRNQDLEFLAKILKKHKIFHVNYMGLIRHQNRQKKYDYIDITNNYIAYFSNELAQLGEIQKKYVLMHIKLQIFRYYLLEKKQIKKALKHLKDNKIKISLAIRYLFHLFVRFITKRVYGFNLPEKYINLRKAL